MLLAAGRGERMRPLTDDRPKPLLEAGGQPLLHYPLHALARAGVQRVVVNLAWRGQRIRDWLGNGARYGLEVRYSDEGAQALETGGGILKALPLLGPDAFWLVNGDVYSDYSFPAISLADGDLAHLVMVPNPDHHPGGDFCLDDGRIRADGSSRLTYSGLALLHPKLLDGQTPGIFPLAPLLIDAMKQGRVSGELHAGAWTDVGTPERLVVLDRALRDPAAAGRRD